MRFLPSALLLFFSICLALPLLHAAENRTELPPAAPSGEGPIFARAILSNGTPVANSPLIILARSTKSETVYRLITDQSGRFLLSLDSGKYELDSVLDYYETPGIDFASTASFDSSSKGNTTFIFYPSGSVSGKALHSGSPLSKATVRVSCAASPFDYERINGGTAVRSGEAGDFLFRALPAGTCVISASTDSLAESVEVQVRQGQSSSATIELRSKASDFDWLPFALAGAAAILIAAFFAGRKLFPQHASYPQERANASPPAQPKGKKKKAGEEGQGEDAPGIPGPKAKAVLATLSDREADIAKFLMKCGGRAKRSSLQHKLLIPKTSLLRNLRSLERKNIVKLTPFGRNLLAELNGKLFD